MSTGGEAPRNLFVRDSFGRKFEDRLLHFLCAGELGELLDRDGNAQGGCLATDPDDARLGAITRDAVQDDLFNEASQKSLLLFTREQVLFPDPRQFFSDSSEG